MPDYEQLAKDWLDGVAFIPDNPKDAERAEVLTAMVRHARTDPAFLTALAKAIERFHDELLNQVLAGFPEPMQLEHDRIN